MPKCPQCRKEIDYFKKTFANDYVIYSCPFCDTFLAVVDPDPFDKILYATEE